jgi:flagellar protein FliO/FliZ
MTLRRFLAATALAVLIGAQTSVAWADGRSAHDGRAPGTAHTASIVNAHDRVRHSARHAATRGKRETGIFSSENTPLNVGTKATKKSSAAGGSSILRTLFGLVVVGGLIYVIAWVMRRVKRSREDQASGRGLASVATLPLGAGRSLHLVRAGSDVILVGSSEHGVAPIQRYTEQEAIANGVLSEPGADAVLQDAATSFMPDGTPSAEAVRGRWRALDGTAPGGGASIVDALRRLTVRS